MSEPVKSRTYRSSVREEQARRTRQAILDAARRLFAEQGYAATTIAQVAKAAGVAVDTGKEFAFHIPGSGVVWAQNGRFVFGDVGLISDTGLNSFDTNALCGALAS